MVLANQDAWDRYEAAKWLMMRRWREANPDDDFAEEVRAKLTLEPRRHAAYTSRDCSRIAIVLHRTMNRRASLKAAGSLGRSKNRRLIAPHPPAPVVATSRSATVANVRASSKTMAAAFWPS
jgi:hypothetical protein